MSQSITDWNTEAKYGVRGPDRRQVEDRLCATRPWERVVPRVVLVLPGTRGDVVVLNASRDPVEVDRDPRPLQYGQARRYRLLPTRRERLLLCAKRS